jgi:3-dehydroquinate synthase
LKTFEIPGQTGHSTIYVNESFKNLDAYVPGRRLVIITDGNVRRYYQSSFPKADVIQVGHGEDKKNLAAVESIYRQMLDLEIDRSCFVVGIGGGIVCDIAGFAASTYLRGLPFGFVASTLLAQVDAGVGGKNGVNFYGYKNIIGVFRQPSFVIADLEMLKTLPYLELTCGFSEVVKHAVIADSNYFQFLETRGQDALNLDLEAMEHVVYESVRIKSDIVKKDETETGERRKLNFGHTLGHALQKSLCVPHGEAVSAGMVFAADLSVKRNLLSRDEADRIRSLLEAFELPVKIAAFKDSLKEAVRQDKKRQEQGVHFVFLKSIGEAVVEEISIKELEAAIDDLY